jgi:hypothetical protein
VNRTTTAIRESWGRARHEDRHQRPPGTPPDPYHSDHGANDGPTVEDAPQEAAVGTVLSARRALVSGVGTAVAKVRSLAGQTRRRSPGR